VPTRPAILTGLMLGLIFVLGWTPSAVAVGNLKLGPAELHPYFQFAESFDSNVCRTEDMRCQDPKDSTKTKKGTDYFAVFTPGIQVAIPLQNHRFEAEYRADLGRYDEFKTENYSDGRLKSRLLLNFPGGLSVRGKEDWTSGHDAPGYAQNIQIDFYHQNTAGGGLDFDVGSKMRLSADYTHLDLNYADNARNGFRDRKDDTYGGTVYYKFLPKTSALVQYEFTATNFDENNPALLSVDNNAQRGYLGLTWDITARTEGTVKGGYVRKNYKESDITNFGGGILSIDLKQELSQRTSLQFDAVRDVKESNIVTEPYYLTLGGRVAMLHKIHPKVSLKLKTGFSRDQYPNAIPPATRARMDDTWNAGGGLEYAMQPWLSWGLGYDFTQRRSNLSGFGYVDNLYTFSVKALL